jgi:hypothetical protein
MRLQIVIHNGMFAIDGSLLLLTMVFAVVGGLLGAGDVDKAPMMESWVPHSNQ